MPLIFHNCKNFSNLNIGNNVHIGKNCFFDLKDQITIEDNVVISMQTTFITHQDMSKSILAKEYPASQNSIIVKRNSYIGANATVLMGVTIGECCIIAASALIITSILPDTMVGGVPAIELKSRIRDH